MKIIVSDYDIKEIRLVENNIKIIKAFELEQLNSFNNSNCVLELKRISGKLGLQFQTGIANLEEFNNKECLKMKVAHSGYLFFDVSYKGKQIYLSLDDIGSCSYSVMITQLKLNGKHSLLNWNFDNDMTKEVEGVSAFLQSFESKESLASFLDNN